MARVTMITYHALEFMTKGNLTQPVAAHLRPQGCNLRIDSGIFSVPRLGRAGTLHCLAVEGITYDQLGCAEIGLHQHPKYMSQKAHMV